MGRGPRSAGTRLAEDGERRYARVFDHVLQRVAPLEHWRVSVGEFWFQCEPPGHAPRPQGWKLHVSATPASAEEVLERALPVLIEQGAMFKFAKGVDQVRQLVSMRFDRGSGGKFITVYPDHDDHLRELAERLHVATEGLAGPAILSDRPYRPDSLVHYRYGGFSAELRYLDDAGSFVPALIAPDGTLTPDERKAWFSPPPWAPLPVAEAPEQSRPSEVGKPVLLDGRFAVREAIRHSNRGGVYRAEDQRTGEPVIIKQARPHVGGDIDGRDARDWLRHEADMLDILGPAGVTPAKVSLFEYQGHTFLAEEQVPGVSLRQWAFERARAATREPTALADVAELAGQLVAIVRKVHDEGLVLRDLNPANIVLTPEGRAVLIDPEFMARPGEHAINVMTPGYAPPEQVSGPRHGPVLGPTADLYALGASIWYLCAGFDLVLPADDSSTQRTHAERRHAIMDVVAVSNPLVRAFLPLLRALLSDASARPSLDDVAAFVRSCERGSTPRQDPPAIVRLTGEQQQRLLDDSLSVIVAGMGPDTRSLWPSVSAEGRTSDPCALHAGGAGQVEVLRRAVEVGGDEHLREPLRQATSWLAKCLAQEHRVLPGLYFGRAGSAWALYEASIALGEGVLARQAIDYAKRLPVRWPNPDVTHGLAGAGMAQLHLWRRTGDEALRDRVKGCAQQVVSACEVRDGRVAWPTPGTGGSPAGVNYYGFAHGVAGVSTFLLAAGQALEQPSLVEIAQAGGETLIAAAERSGDAASWPSAEQQELGGSDSVFQSWCSGAAGVGTHLVRLWEATGDDRLLELAHGACVTVRDERWLLSPLHCHGLVSSGELLLDMAAATGDSQYLEWAEEHAALMSLRHAVRDGRQVVFGESPQELHYSYNLGLAGVVGFLLRLQHGGSRCFMVDRPGLELGAHPADRALAQDRLPASPVGAERMAGAGR